MIRSAAPLPPSCEVAALVTIVNGIRAVSAPEDRAIARSNPAIFWNRLTTRSTNRGRSQNVSVRRTRSRFQGRGRASSLASDDPMPGPPSRVSAERSPRDGVLTGVDVVLARRGHDRLVLSEDEEAVEDVDAEGEDGQRPPRVVATDRQQGADGAEAGGGDADDPAVGVAGEQRQAGRELDDPEDDQGPAQGVEVVEDEPLVVHEDAGVAQRADAVEDIEPSDDQQQRRDERRST